MSEPKTIKQTVLELYNKHYNVHFISEFLGVDLMTVKSIVLKDDPKKQFKKIEDVPDKDNLKESITMIPFVKRQMVEDMPSVIKGLTLLGYSVKEIADQMRVSEETLTGMIDDIDSVAEAYNEAKHNINIKVVETLLASILPKTLIERHYKMMPKVDGSYEKVLLKEVVKEVGGHVEGIYKWLEFNAPEKFSPKSKTLAEFLKDSGIAIMPADVEEKKWEGMASGQQDNLADMLDNEKKRLNAEYNENT
jgi:transposase-like protein